MKSYFGLGLAMLAGAALGAVGVNSLSAQGKPGAYAVIIIDDILNPDAYQAIVPKAGPAATNAGGRFVVRTDAVNATEGASPKRLVVINFDSMDKLKAWSETAAQKEVNGIRLNATKSRQYFVEGLPGS
jgi:uncharacterized protein (DUF1330 family)